MDLTWTVWFSKSTLFFADLHNCSCRKHPFCDACKECYQGVTFLLGDSTS